VHGTGQRGRVLPEEIELASGNPEDKFVAKLKPGDYFGEQSLLKGQARNATVVAASKELKVAVLNSTKFKELKLGEKVSFAKRKAVQQFDEEAEDTSNRDVNKTSADIELIRKAIRSNKKLTDIVQLTSQQLDTLVAKAFKRECKPGEVFFLSFSLPSFLCFDCVFLLVFC